MPAVKCNTVYTTPRRTQDRNKPPVHLPFSAPFENEADTDFSLAQNRAWAEKIIEKWKTIKLEKIPLVIGGKEIQSENGRHRRRSRQSRACSLSLCAGRLGTCRQSSCSAQKNRKRNGARQSVEERCNLSSHAAQKMREKGAMI